MELPEKPRLRGVFHQWAFVAALAAGTTLVALADGARERTATWIYAASLAAMFGASALYHRGRWRSSRVRTWLRRLDHSAIFLLIAGTYTPFAVLAFDGVTGDIVLVVVWAGAAAGLLLNLFWIHAPEWVAALVYITLGWVGVLTLPELFTRVGVAGGVLVIVGGGLYTLGAIGYAAGRPNPWPSVFGFHEIFHLVVIAAATTQYVAVALVVL